jgi:hypothetical protein
MADEPKRPYLTDLQATKFHHQPGWAAYAAKLEAERKEREQNARVVLKEKHMNTGSARYTISVIQRKKGEKPYLRISGYIEKTGYRGTIVVFAPYVPTFVSMITRLAEGLE